MPREIRNHRISLIVRRAHLGYICPMSLREKVEKLLPNWESWYPTLFEAARDLGVIRAEVCDPNTLLLTRRHRRIAQQAEEMHKENWGGKDLEPKAPRKRKKRRRR